MPYAKGFVSKLMQPYYNIPTVSIKSSDFSNYSLIVN